MTTIQTNIPADFALLLNGTVSILTPLDDSAANWLRDEASQRHKARLQSNCVYDDTALVLVIAADAAGAGFRIGHVE